MPLKKRLGEMLVEAGIIDAAQLQAALGHQRNWGGKIGQALVDLKLATEAQVVSALSRKFGYEVTDVSALEPSPELDAALRLVPRELALRQTFLPVASDTGTITVVMADPSNVTVIDEIAFRTGRRVKVALAGDRQIAAAVRRLCFADEAPRHRPAIAFDEPLHLQAQSLLEPDPLGEPILATGLALAEEVEREDTAVLALEGGLDQALARAARGEDAPQLLVALVQVLVKRGVVTEAELLEALDTISEARPA
jgi:hypothetical protein